MVKHMDDSGLVSGSLLCNRPSQCAYDLLHSGREEGGSAGLFFWQQPATLRRRWVYLSLHTTGLEQQGMTGSRTQPRWASSGPRHTHICAIHGTRTHSHKHTHTTTHICNHHALTTKHNTVHTDKQRHMGYETQLGMSGRGWG